ncbi:DUF2232 domain-containing protein [Roseomonas sp. E05]|uniref:DUF2232 domain-containing protein n=1 Tax=Roseomonas sp. E05 TaxID=3046310 RepID=UPI0024B95C4E|nr:DUF2232 domain-containing protein [Roseomonas sp. E05]MDJ0386759.1 DUF2232 domain-containing protein [Roseomonas sp. E05]
MAAQQPRIGLIDDPRLLAGAAGGLVSALAALWAFRGLPAGLGLFWLSPLPLFLAGLGFGKLALAIAVGAGGAALLAVTPGLLPLLLWLALYGVPVLLLVAVGLRRGPRIDLTAPMALLGLWPAGLTLLASILAAGHGGLEAVLRSTVELGLAQMEAEVPATAVDQIVRLNAAALALWLAIALVVNAAAAQGFLGRRGLALAPAPRWREARLPAWYPALPALAGIAWLLTGPEDALLPLSLCLVLAVPLLLQGLAAMHTRLVRHSARLPLLILFYVLILVFSLPGALVLVVLGLLEQYGRRNPPANM